MGHVNVRLHLRHEVDATLRMALGLGGVGHVNSCWTILKAGVPDKIASKCGSKPNPLLWKYIRSAQWRWEMNSADLLAKTGLYLAKL